MSTMVRIFVFDECVHEREVHTREDVIAAMDECRPGVGKGCAVYIAGPRRVGSMIKVADGTDEGVWVPFRGVA